MVFDISSSGARGRNFIWLFVRKIHLAKYIGSVVNALIV
jgi:hypothetical protein